MHGTISLTLIVAAAAATALSAQATTETYARAERMLPTNADQLVLRDKVHPNWIAGGPRFWYRVTTLAGAEFVFVDPVKRVRRPAFDHPKLAAALGAAAETTLVADSLPFETLEWKEVRGLQALPHAPPRPARRSRGPPDPVRQAGQRAPQALVVRAAVPR